jgi:hypothetical protein
MDEMDQSGWYHPDFLRDPVEEIRFAGEGLGVKDAAFANDIYSIASTGDERERFEAGWRLYLALCDVVLPSGSPVYTLKVWDKESLENRNLATLHLFTLPFFRAGAKRYEFHYSPDTALRLKAISLSHAKSFSPIEPGRFAELRVVQTDCWRIRNEVLKILERRKAPRSDSFFPETP